jgi:hypothetical protein
MRKWDLLVILLIAILTLAACNGDDKDKKDASEPTENGTLAELPGCEDVNSEECPAPLQMNLDGTIAEGGITISYPARYFNAASNVNGVPIEITPSENNRYEDRAMFQVYFADSVDQALAELVDPTSKPWTADNLSSTPGVIGVTKDQSQTPPVNTTIGAFPLPDNRVLVFRVVTTGEYGWPLYSEMYRAMLESITLGDAPAATEAPAG